MITEEMRNKVKEMQAEMIKKLAEYSGKISNEDFTEIATIFQNDLNRRVVEETGYSIFSFR